MSSEIHIPARPWTRSNAPGRILAIRLQAMGDVVISLRYLQDLRTRLPAETRLDLLVLRESSPLPKNLELFNRVFIIDGGRRFKLQLVFMVPVLLRLLFQRYDVVLDVQNSPISRIVRAALRPRAWSEFDKVSTLPAGERTRLTIGAALPQYDLGGVNAEISRFTLKSDLGTGALLKKGGWNRTSRLVVLNPGGAFASRHWPEASFAQFARLWLERFPDSQFLLLGIRRMREQAQRLQASIGPSVINLVEQTSTAQAFAILQKTSFVLSEDSGLMHMAWVSGIPTLALFGSSRSDWARPLGPHVAFLDGSGLECAPCLEEICRFGDQRCLARHTPEQVFGLASILLQTAGDGTVAE